MQLVRKKNLGTIRQIFRYIYPKGIKNIPREKKKICGENICPSIVSHKVGPNWTTFRFELKPGPGRWWKAEKANAEETNRSLNRYPTVCVTHYTTSGSKGPPVELERSRKTRTASWRRPGSNRDLSQVYKERENTGSNYIRNAESLALCLPLHHVGFFLLSSFSPKGTCLCVDLVYKGSFHEKSQESIKSFEAF